MAAPPLTPDELGFGPLLDALREPALVLDLAAGRVVLANRAAGALLGRPPAALAALALDSLLTTPADLAADGPEPLVLSLRHAAGHALAAAATLSSLTGPLAAGLALAVLRPVAAGPSALGLVRAGALLGPPARPDETLANLARQAIPALADYCVLDLLGEDGSLAPPTLAHRDPAAEPLLRELRRRYPPQSVASYPTATVLAALQPIVLTDLTEERLAAFAQDAEHLRLMRAFRPTSYLCFPLLVRERLLGTLTLGMAGSGRRHSPEDVAAAEAFAHVAALAADNAHLFAAERAARAEAEALYGAAFAIGAQPDLGGRLERVLDAALALTGAEQADVLLLDTAGTELVLAAARGVAPRRTLARLPAGVGLAGAVLRAGATVRSDDLPADPRAWEPEEAYRRGIRAWVGAPLADDSGTFGLVSAYGTRPNLFSAAHERRLGVLAAQAGAAVREARLRAELEAALRARDEFLSVASHELKTPVAGIKGYAQNLLRARARGRLDDDRLDRSLRTINAASDHLASLTNDLLDVARLRLGHLPFQPRPLDLAALVREAIERFRARLDDHHRLLVSGADAPLPAEADPERIGQVLDNLLENAAKYSPHGGPIRVALRPAAGGALIRVRDAGIGLPAGAETTIFAPFGRASNAAASHIPGMGLGLYICRSIAELHGGRLWATSPGEGRGTGLHLWLPLGPAAAENA